MPGLPPESILVRAGVIPHVVRVGRYARLRNSSRIRVEIRDVRRGGRVALGPSDVGFLAGQVADAPLGGRNDV